MGTGVELDGLKDWVQIAQSLITIAAILIAGVWAYFVFVVGRSATAQVQIGCHLKQVITSPDRAILCISVTLTNTGRTRVDGLSCEIIAAPVASRADQRASLAFLEPMPERILDEGELGSDFAWGKIFKETVALEPNEAVAEDILLAIRNGSPTSAGDHSMFAAEVHCRGNILGGRIILRQTRRPKDWGWRGILDSRGAGE
jgi:hypothetical protein